MPQQPGYTAPGEEKLRGIEPYWWSVIIFASLAILILIMTQIVYR
jgi:hypothetical protein